MGTDRENDSGIFSFDVAAEIPEARLAKMDSATTVSVAGVGEKPFGVTRRSSFAAGEGTTVSHKSKPGSITFEAGGAIAAGADLYGIADGKVVGADPGGGAIVVGEAIESADADGDYFQGVLT